MGIPIILVRANWWCTSLVNIQLNLLLGIQMIVSSIVAIDESNIIGVNGKIPWNIPYDIQRFRYITENRTVIMGAKTWDSLPNKPLPNRKNIIISSSSSIYNESLKYENVHVRRQLPQALSECLEGKEREVFLIGGVEIYKEGFNYVDKIYLTLVHQNNLRLLSRDDTCTICDAFEDLSDFYETRTEETYEYTFTIYRRKS